MEKHSLGNSISNEDWNSLFSSKPYQQLKKREAAFNRGFPDDEFRAFLLSPENMQKLASYISIIQSWQRSDFTTIGQQALSYLPSEASIRADVYPLIKPKPNSFVWGEGDRKDIFLYLDVTASKDVFSNTVTHELHHIGLMSVPDTEDSLLSENQKRALTWLGGFGEGVAMLAAAGSPNIHPHKFDHDSVIYRWDQDIADFNEDLQVVESFFQKILKGELSESSQIREAAAPFWGVQGPWYTVGYVMAKQVEQVFGRDILVNSLKDFRVLLQKYNESLSKRNPDGLRAWSEDFLKALNSN